MTRVTSLCRRALGLASRFGKLAILVCLTYSSLSAQTDSLLQVYRDTTQTTAERAKALDRLAFKGFLPASPDSAVKYGELLIDFLNSHETSDRSPLPLIQALNGTALGHLYLGEYDISLDYLNIALRKAEAADAKKEQIIAIQRLSYIYHKRDEREKEGEGIRQGLTLSRELGDSSLIAAFLANLGVHLKSQGQHAEAIDSYYQSLALFDALGDSARVADLMNNLANIHRDQGDYSRSLAIHQQSYEARKKVGDDRLVNISLNNLGVLNVLLADSVRESGNRALAADYDRRAEHHLQEALSLADSRSDIEESSTARLWLGIIAERQGEYEKAIDLIESGLGTKRGLGNRSGMSYALNALGAVHYKMALDRTGSAADKKFSKALECYEEAQQLSAEGRASAGQLQSLHGLYQVNRALGHNTEAIGFLEDYQHLHDSVMSLKNQRSVFEQQYRYAYETEAFKDSVLAAEERGRLVRQYATQRRNLMIAGGAILFLLAIAYLFYRSRMRQRELSKEAEATQLRLQSAQSEMKALRSQMNPHFIFNALQSIQTFLIRKNTFEANEYLLKFSKLMRLVLENSVHDEVPIEDDCAALRLYMELESIRLEHPFTYSIDIDQRIDPAKIRIPPLILQPFVENAIWHGLHSKGSNGHIGVHIDKEDDRLLIKVLDNGIGREASEARKVASTSTRVKKESLGMKITQDRLLIRDERTGTTSSMEVVDLKDEDGVGCGTEVRLEIGVVDYE